MGLLEHVLCVLTRQRGTQPSPCLLPGGGQERSWGSDPRLIRPKKLPCVSCMKGLRPPPWAVLGERDEVRQEGADRVLTWVARWLGDPSASGAQPGAGDRGLGSLPPQTASQLP